VRVAGVSAEIFTPGALREIHRLSGGIPRIVNVCCDRALLGAYTREQRTVNAALIRRATGEVYGRRYFPRWASWLAAGLTIAAVAAIFYIPWRSWMPAPAPSAPPVAPPAASVAAPAPSAAMAEPPAAPAPAADLDALLAENAATTTEAGAYRRLLALWGSALTGDQDPCGQAARAGLACLDQHGSWAQVHLLNRPAVLTLTDRQGQRHRVVLTALDEHSATLTLGERSERVPIDAVSRLWFGDFTVVWRPKSPRVRRLAIGSSGEGVRWLRRKLSALHGSSVDPQHDDVYDQAMADAVQEFQRQHRLLADGIAGVLTQVVLDATLADPQSPLLEPPAAHGG
jgi:general secretion pathway protein A